MEDINISTWSIVVSVIATFILGFIWYTPLFGKAWAKELGLDMSVKPSGTQMMKGLSLGLLGNVFLAYVFAHNISAWSYVPGAGQMSEIQKLASAVVFTWLGFYLPVDLNTVAWEGRSWKLFAINTGYHFCLLLVAAVVLTYMN